MLSNSLTNPSLKSYVNFVYVLINIVQFNETKVQFNKKSKKYLQQKNYKKQGDSL